MSNFFFESLALIGALLQDESGNSYLNENPFEIIKEDWWENLDNLKSEEKTSDN